MALKPKTRRAGPLVDPAWLAQNLGSVVIVDATYFMGTTDGEARRAHEEAHIPDARFFDIDGIADHRTTLPHMMPDATAFAQAMGALGIGNDDTVIVYDRSPNHFSAPRVWWTFRTHGHTDVAVLEGGLTAWTAMGLPVDSGPSTIEPRHYRINGAPCNLIASIDDVRRIVADAKQADPIIDARSRGRFDGTTPEPRPGLRSGHIPGSASLPFDSLTNPDGSFATEAQIHALLQSLAITEGRPVIASCGSGMTACVVALALTRAGRSNVSVYDLSLIHI